MSDYENPYKSPETTIIPEKSQYTGLNDQMARYLYEASPWLKFIGVMGFIGFGSLCLAALVSIIVALNDGGAASIGIFFMYGVMAPITFMPAYFTYNFGIKISSFKQSNSEKDLEEAFKNNKSLWKFNGILYIVSLSVMVLAIFIAMFAGIAAVAGLFN